MELLKEANMTNDKITQAIAEAYKTMKKEELKGDQHEIDANKNNKIDAHDFHLLRKQKDAKEEYSLDQMIQNVKNKSLPADHPKDNSPLGKMIQNVKNKSLPADHPKDDSPLGQSIQRVKDASMSRGVLKVEETEPKSEKEKDLAALGHPKDKVTHKDVLIGRGVLKKEGWDSKKPAVSEQEEPRRIPERDKEEPLMPKKPATLGGELAMKAVQRLIAKNKTNEENEPRRIPEKDKNQTLVSKNPSTLGAELAMKDVEKMVAKNKTANEEPVNELGPETLISYAMKAKGQQRPGIVNPRRDAMVDLAVKKASTSAKPINNSYVPEEKEDAPFAGPYVATPKKQKGQKSDPSMSRARDLARKAMQNLAQKKKDQKVAEEFVLEGKMGQLHADIGDHLDKHIKDYNAGNLGHDSFGEKVVAVHKKIADLHGISQDAAKKHVNDYVDRNIKEEFELDEATKSGDDSLHDWFSKSKSSDGKPGWVQLGGKYAGKPCAKQPGQTTKPKCGSSKMKRDLSKDEEDAAFRRKNEKDPNPERSGKAKMVATEEKDACYHKVKARYNIWPSAYASGALVKCRKVGADNWGNKSEEFELNEGNDDVGEMIKDKLKIIINRAKEMHDGIRPNQDIPEWVKSKITLAQDYVSTACDYSCGSEQLGEEVSGGNHKKQKGQVDERCWDGYKPVQGKDAYSKGSCKKEEVENIDEISKSTLGSYIKKASHDVATKSALTRAFKDKSEKEKEKENLVQARKDDEKSNKMFDKSWKRRQGIAKAADRLTKEENEITEDMETPDIKVRQTYTKAYADHYKRALKLNPKGASKRAEAMAYDTVKIKHGDDAHDALKTYHEKNQNESYEQIDEELSSRAKLVKELYNKAKEEKKSKKDKFDPDPQMEIMPSPQYAQPKK